MRNEFRKLRIQQLNRALAPFLAAAQRPRPHKGWVRAIREAIGVSSGDLATRMRTSRQLALQQEKAESEDRITLKSLRALAHALDCDLVYALVPRGGSLQALFEAGKRAETKAGIPGDEHSTASGDQAGDNFSQAIDAEADRPERKLTPR